MSKTVLSLIDNLKECIFEQRDLGFDDNDIKITMGIKISHLISSEVISESHPDHLYNIPTLISSIYGISVEIDRNNPMRLEVAGIKSVEIPDIL